jgi:hypothetical protein
LREEQSVTKEELDAAIAADEDLQAVDRELAEEILGWRDAVAKHEPVDLPLHWPIIFGSKRIETLHLKPPSGSHLSHFPVDRKQVTQAHYLVAVGHCSGLQPPEVALLAAEDATRAIMVVELFWRGSPRTRRNSSGGSPSARASPAPTST